jgi:hypothetical protein
MDFLPHPLIVASVALAVWGIYIILVRPRVYDKRFDLVARDLRLQFFAEGDPLVQNELWHLRLFNQGHSRNISNMISGRVGKVEVAIFNYEYSTGGAEDEKVHHHSVICFHSKRLELPVFEIHGKGLHRGSALGYYDMEIDLHGGFSRRYLLRAPEEEPVYECLTKKMLKGIASHSGISIEANRDWLLYYRVDHQFTPRDARTLLKDGFKIYNLLKSDKKS